jgi:hypothetical protein
MAILAKQLFSFESALNSNTHLTGTKIYVRFTMMLLIGSLSDRHLLVFTCRDLECFSETDLREVSQASPGTYAASFCNPEARGNGAPFGHH